MGVRYFSIIDGASVTDIASGEPHNDASSGATFNYYLYVRRGGDGVIMRESSDETEYRFFVFHSGNLRSTQQDANAKTERQNKVNSVWTNRQSHVYVRPSDYALA